MLHVYYMDKFETIALDIIRDFSADAGQVTSLSTQTTR